MELGLRGKAASATGGSEGIGKAAAQRMAAEGQRLSSVFLLRNEQGRLLAQRSMSMMGLRRWCSILKL